VKLVSAQCQHLFSNLLVELFSSRLLDVKILRIIYSCCPEVNSKGFKPKAKQVSMVPNPKSGGTAKIGIRKLEIVIACLNSGYYGFDRPASEYYLYSDGGDNAAPKTARNQFRGPENQRNE
jgi:hypothetical protein